MKRITATKGTATRLHNLLEGIINRLQAVSKELVEKVIPHITKIKTIELAKEAGVSPALIYAAFRAARISIKDLEPDRRDEYLKIIKDYSLLDRRSSQQRAVKAYAQGLYSQLRAAKELGIPPITLTSWLKRNNEKIPPPSHRVGCNLYYTAKDLEQIKKIKADYFKKKGSK